MTNYFCNHSTVDSVNGVTGNEQNINNIRALKMFLLPLRGISNTYEIIFQSFFFVKNVERSPFT